HHHLRLHHEGTPHREHLLLAAAHRPGQLTTALAESGEQGEDVLHGRVDLCPVPLEVGAHLDVLAHSHLAEDDAFLGHIPGRDREDAVRTLTAESLLVDHVTT